MGYRERWLSKDGQRLVSKVLKALQRGRSLDVLGLGAVEGRVDLRGLTLAEPASSPLQVGGLAFNLVDGRLPEIHKARLRGLDLTGSRLRHLRLHEVGFEDCVLRDADLTDFKAWRSSFERCDMAGADLTNGTLSWWDRGVGNVWQDCRFDAIEFNGVVAEGADFRACSFEHVRWENMVFTGCTFTDCRVAGSLRNVAFYGTNVRPDVKPPTMTNFDLRECQFDQVAFVGLRLAGVQLPPRDSVVILSHGGRVLESLQSRLAGGTGDAADAISRMIKNIIKHVGPDDDLYLDYATVRRAGGEPAVALLRELLSSGS